MLMSKIRDVHTLDVHDDPVSALRWENQLIVLLINVPSLSMLLTRNARLRGAQNSPHLDLKEKNQLIVLPIKPQTK